MTIQVYAMERRTMMRPGRAPVTIERETVLRDGHGRKTVRVRRGRHVVSNVTEALNGAEKHKVGKRKYVRGLYKKAERRTMKRLHSREI
jgi:hypothetical protein